MVADCAYSTSDDWYHALREAGLPYVVALKPHRGTWARADQPHTPIEAVPPTPAWAATALTPRAAW